MANPITDNLKVGTLGELLVQLRLLEFDVQSAPPIKDSGNDLIAVRGEAFRAIQVKTTAGTRVDTRNLPEHYHIIALVYLVSNDVQLFLDRSDVFLIPRSVWEANGRRKPADLEPYAISAHQIDVLFREDTVPRDL